MSTTSLHIVCLDVPYPPDYGGVFDLFYKIKYLHGLGVQIHLHCFEYGRGRQPELSKYCKEVHYYRRNKNFFYNISRLPYIVSSRKNKHLLHNLNKTNAPVLLEGIHCTYYLYARSIQSKKIWVRLHNVEFEYYAHLAKSTGNIFKKLYYSIESKRLKKYEAAIAQKAPQLAVTQKDKQIYEDVFQAKETIYLPIFLPFQTVKSIVGKGDFCLYHGNLSVAENDKAVKWLLKNIFNHTNIPLVVAGKNPWPSLQKLIAKNNNATLIENPTEEKMQGLIQNAHIHILPSFNATGIKIKLLNALFNGRFIITNFASVEGTGLEPLCTIAETPQNYKEAIRQIFNMSFTEKQKVERSDLLNKQYDNEKNAQKLMGILFS